MFLSGEKHKSLFNKNLTLKVMDMLLASFLFLTFLPAVAFADMGPKPDLVVKVENEPQELYYLDILEQDNSDAEIYEYNQFDDDTEMDQQLLQALKDAIPDGWHGCISEGTGGAPVFGSLTGEEGKDGVSLHEFSYLGLPDTYRLIIVTKSGQRWISDVLHRNVLQSSVTLDWTTGVVHVPSFAGSYVLQFLATFLPTIIIEGILLLLFRFSLRDNWKVFLVTNLITQGALAVYFSISAVKSGVGFWYHQQFIFAEIVITVIETLIYMRKLKGQSVKRAAVYGVCANLCSAVIGYFIAGPVWQFVVSIS